MKSELIVGIHPDKVGEESYSAKWTEFLLDRGIEVKSIDLLAPDALDQAQQCDGIMWRWLHNQQHKQSAQRILYAIEHLLNIPVFPNSVTSWHYDEKVTQNYVLHALGAPTPKTWLFWDRDEALEWSRTAPYPVVFKLSTGAGSSNVLKVNTNSEAENLIKRMFNEGIFPYTMNEYRSKTLPTSVSDMLTLGQRIKNAMIYALWDKYPPLHPTWWKPERGYVYFQEFLPDNSFDTRVTVIGDRAFAYRRMNRSKDFRASGSGIFDTNPNLIDEDMLKIAFEVSKKGQFQSMAYDFLYQGDDPVICEISYTFVDWMVHSCLGHWNSDLNWVEGQMWPQEAQVEVFLKQIRGQ